MELKKSEDVQEYVFAFYNLLVTILKRRALFRVFEKNLLGKDTEESVINNSFVSYYITDYTRGQLIDLRKFFETDRSSYRIIDLVKYIDLSDLKSRYNYLEEVWKQKFKDQVDKQVAHIDRNTENLRKEVGKIEIDEFIDKVDALMVVVIGNLREKGVLFLQEELRDPNGDFLKVKQDQEFKEYINWICKK